MCIGIPGQVVAISGPLAQVRRGARLDWYNALPVPGLSVGAWVVTQANLVIAEVSEAEAERTLSVLAELEAVR